MVDEIESWNFSMPMNVHEILVAARQQPEDDRIWFSEMLIRIEDFSSMEEIDYACAAETARCAANANTEITLELPTDEEVLKLETQIDARLANSGPTQEFLPQHL